MTVSHHIDDLNKLIITTWKGDADVKKFFRYYLNYREKVQNEQKYYVYNEIVNFSSVGKLDFDFNDLKNFARLVASFDNGQSTKLAMIVNPGKAYVLAKAYAVIQKLVPGNNKAVNVFVDYFAALKWLNRET